MDLFKFWFKTGEKVCRAKLLRHYLFIMFFREPVELGVITDIAYKVGNIC